MYSVHQSCSSWGARDSGWGLESPSRRGDRAIGNRFLQESRLYVPLKSALSNSLAPLLTRTSSELSPEDHLSCSRTLGSLRITPGSLRSSCWKERDCHEIALFPLSPKILMKLYLLAWKALKISMRSRPILDTLCQVPGWSIHWTSSRRQNHLEIGDTRWQKPSQR